MGPSHADELLRQILANPDDLALRAVHADALQAAGDPRGELVALELAGDPDPARRRALLAAHAAAWWPELPRHRLATRHGFVERVAADAGELASARALFGREPVREVELVDAHPSTLPLAEPAWQAHLRVFRARGHLQRLDAICHAPFAHRLVELDAAGCFLDDAARLGDLLPACRRLVLADNPYLGRHLPRLLDWQHLPALEMLDLSHTGTTAEVLRELLARDLRALRVLKLSRNPLGDAGARVLAAALPRLPALVRVDVLDGELDPPALAALHDACPPTLVELALSLADLTGPLLIDLVGTTIELVRLDAQRWAVEVDGTQRAIRWRRVDRDDSDRPPREGRWQMAELAPLEPLGLAIAAGAARELTRSGATVPLGSSTGYVYNTSVYTRQTVALEVSPTASTIAISFDDYTSIE